MSAPDLSERIRFFLLCSLCVLAVNGEGVLHAQTDARPSPLLLIADFNRGVQNHVGGFHNASERSPSAVSMARVSEVFRGGGGRSLRITAMRKAGGFAAVWISFHDFRQRRKKYLDTGGYSHLSFWVKGKHGGEKFRIKLADDAWDARQDGLDVGPVSRFLTVGITREWQEVLIPFRAFSLLDRKAMSSLTFDFHAPGETTIFVDDIGFKRDPGFPTPLTPKGTAKIGKQRDLPRAMWNWNPLPLLLDPLRQKDFLTFCKRERIARVWLQLPTRSVRSPETGRIVDRPAGDDFHVEIVHPARLRSFLAAAHAEGIKVEALDGAPEYAVKKFHHVPLAIVDAVIAFNRESAPAERFDGVHFDNEPYLLIGWHFPEVRKQILKEFLELNLECQRRIRSRSDMVYGIDIPFWWQSVDPQTGKVIAPATLNGVEKAASFHCIDMLDSVGIMNYRNTADGADGMLANGLELLEYADKARRARIYLGVETITEPPVDVWFAVGLPRKEAEEILKAGAPDFFFLSRINGFRAHVLDDGANLHFGIAIPPGLSPKQYESASDTLVKIAEMLDAPHAEPGKGRAAEFRQAAMRKIARAPEWKDPKVRNIPHPSGKSGYAGFQAKSLFLSKITFGAKTIQEMRFEVRIAEEEFSAYDQYAGIAIHHYETYRRLVESTGDLLDERSRKDPGS
jgi:hypothetical protein